MTSEITLGQKIRELRGRKGMSLRELATKAEVSAPFLSDLEHGRRGTEQLDKIAKALGVPTAELNKLKGTVSAEMKTLAPREPVDGAVAHGNSRLRQDGCGPQGSPCEDGARITLCNGSHSVTSPD